MAHEVSRAHFESMFERIRQEWPPKLDVNEKHVVGSRGLKIPSLVTCHDAIESKIDESLDGVDHQVAQMIAFAIFTALHSRIRASDLGTISRSDIDKSDVIRIISAYEEWSIVD